MAYRSLAVLTALLALTTSAHSVKFQARHDGEAHQPVHDDHNAELRARQVNGPAAGIAADPERTVLPITIPTAVASQPSEAAVPQETVQALDAVVPTTSSTPILPSANYINSSNGAGTGGPVGYIGEPINNSSDPDGGIDSYSFPSSIVQIPVMTICPNMSGTPFVAIPTAAFMNATAILANGSSTTFLSNTQPTPVLPSAGPGDAGTDPIASAPLSRSGDGIDTDDNRDANAIDKRQPSATSKASDPTARILLGDGGCQTIYSPITTAVCSTTIKLAALPVATVTDCNQYLTFSSQTSDCSRSATPAPVAGGVAADQSMTAASLSVALVLTPSAPGTYYAAHWYDMRSGGVPSNVVVEECPGGCGVNVVSCITARERWSVSYVIGVAVRTSVASFSGPAIVTAGTLTLTTTISFSSTLTTTITTTSQTIVKSRLQSTAPSTSSSSAQPTSMPEPLPSTSAAVGTPTVTLQLDQVTQSTLWVGVTETHTNVVFETRTRTP